MPGYFSSPTMYNPYVGTRIEKGESPSVAQEAPLLFDGILANLPKLSISPTSVGELSQIAQGVKLPCQVSSELKPSSNLSAFKSQKFRPFHRQSLFVKVLSAKLDLAAMGKNRSYMKYKLRITSSGRQYTAWRNHCEVMKMARRLRESGYKLPIDPPEMSSLFSFNRTCTTSYRERPQCTCKSKSPSHDVIVSLYQGSMAEHECSCPCQKSAASTPSRRDSGPNYDFIEESRVSMEEFLQELFTRFDFLEFHCDVQQFIWEPLMPKGSLGSIAELQEEMDEAVLCEEPITEDFHGDLVLPLAVPLPDISVPKAQAVVPPVPFAPIDTVEKCTGQEDAGCLAEVVMNMEDLVRKGKKFLSDAQCVKSSDLLATPVAVQPALLQNTVGVGAVAPVVKTAPPSPEIEPRTPPASASSHFEDFSFVFL